MSTTRWLQISLFTALTGCPIGLPTPDDACAIDDDCLPTQACETIGGARMCIPTRCDSDEECDDGETCKTSLQFDGCSRSGVRQCTTWMDHCRSDNECVESEICVPPRQTIGEPLDCRPEITCAIGRPLTVGAENRVAPLVPGTDWGSAAVHTPDTGLAEHWLAIAALEHASVASFARFALELLALGAPPELLRACHEASLDELRHAQQAFAIAARFSEEPLQPGPLDLSNVQPATTPAAVLERLIREAVVGETIGAALAREQALHTRDPEIAATLFSIAEDEARHAAFAWRTLHWICDRWPALREHVQPLLDAASTDLLQELARSGPGRPGMGVLDAATTIGLTQEVLKVVVPRALLAC